MQQALQSVPDVVLVELLRPSANNSSNNKHTRASAREDEHSRIRERRRRINETTTTTATTTTQHAKSNELYTIGKKRREAPYQHQYGTPPAEKIGVTPLLMYDGSRFCFFRFFRTPPTTTRRSRATAAAGRPQALPAVGVRVRAARDRPCRPRVLHRAGVRVT